MKRLLLSFIMAALGLAAMLPSSGRAADLYVDPASACVTPTGTQDCAFPTPAAAMSMAKAGDVILLADGDYAGWTIKGKKPEAPITVRSLKGKGAHIENLVINGGTRNITFQNLSIWATDPVKSGLNRVDINTATDLVFDGLDVRSGKDAFTYPTWTKEQWADRSMKGLQSRFAERVTVRNSTFTGLGFAVVLMSPGDRFIDNQIRGFSGDGLRVLGDNSVVKGNLITDCARINANHPDAIQSWSQGGRPVTGLILDSNILVNWSANQRPGFVCQMQGIGFFDGFYDKLIIQNNIVTSQTYHGISVYGGRGVTIVNNTVVNAAGAKGGSPWIGVFAHKNKTPSTDVLIANNVSMGFKGTATNAANRIVSVNNTTIKDPGPFLATLKLITATP